jgi:hypothetical protein
MPQAGLTRPPRPKFCVLCGKPAEIETIESELEKIADGIAYVHLQNSSLCTLCYWAEIRALIAKISQWLKDCIR